MIKEYNDIPLAIDLDFITNIFWFKLNKGLGKTYPINIKNETKIIKHLEDINLLPVVYHYILLSLSTESILLLLVKNICLIFYRIF